MNRPAAHNAITLAFLCATFIVSSTVWAAQDNIPAAGEAPVWPKVREAISFPSAASPELNKFQVFEDGSKVDANFKKDIRPASVLLLIDVSSSMRSNFGPIVQAAQELIATARPEDEFEIVSFSWPAYVEQAFTGDRTKLYDALSNLKLAGGSTALFDAIDASIKEFGHAHGSTKRVMVLFSDSVDSSSKAASGKSVIRTLKALEAPSMYIVCLAPSLRQGVQAAARLSNASGGMTFAADHLDRLELQAAQIAQLIDGLSILEYTSPREKRDGKIRKIQVRYEMAPGASKIDMVFRQEYYAPSQ